MLEFGGKIFRIEEPLVIYRYHEACVTNEVGELVWSEYLEHDLLDLLQVKFTEMIKGRFLQTCLQADGRMQR